MSGATRSLVERGTMVRVFVSYSHRDAYWMEALLPLLRFSGAHVKPWNDKEIKPGLRWDREIKNALDEMDVFIPLISVHFAVSEYICEVESKVAKRRYENQEIEIVPVLVHDPGDGECDWLMEIQRVPPGDKSWVEVLREFQQHDRALTPIREGIKTGVERARERKKQRAC